MRIKCLAQVPVATARTQNPWSEVSHNNHDATALPWPEIACIPLSLQLKSSFPLTRVGKGTTTGRCVWKAKYFRDRRSSQVTKATRRLYRLLLLVIKLVPIKIKKKGPIDINYAYQLVCLKGPSQPHLCYCLHARIWLLYFIRSLSKRRKITVKLLKIIKHTFRNTAYSKTIRIRFTMLYQ